MIGTKAVTLRSHQTTRGWRRPLLAVTLALAVLTGPVVAGFAAAQAAPTGDQGEVYVIHGLAEVTADIVVDGVVQQQKAEPRAVVGPLALPPGGHTVTLQPSEGDALTAQVDVAAGSSSTVVAHLPADATAGPVLTVFVNDLSPVGMGKARLVVAHTAAVPPADVRIDGNVLFSNVANAESLELMVPAGSYSVDIVPTGTTSPVVFGPVNLPVEAGTLTRVFAFGDPTRRTMDAIVQTFPLQQEGSAAPSLVPTGNGGQAALVSTGSASSPWLALAVAALASTVAAGHLLRRRREPAALPD